MTRREQILNQLIGILRDVDGIEAAERNLDQFPQEVRPMVILLDGDEEVPPEFRDHKFLKGRAPLLIEMTPLIELSVSDVPDEVGLTANELLGRIQSAVLTDATLQNGVLGSNGAVYYVACDGRTSHSMAMDCDLQIRFAFRYPLFPTAP